MIIPKKKKDKSLCYVYDLGILIPDIIVLDPPGPVDFIFKEKCEFKRAHHNCYRGNLEEFYASFLNHAYPVQQVVKPVYLTIIISAAIIVSVLTFAIVMQPIHQNQPDAYVITDYHPNATKIWGTDIVQNQIFHFADYNMSATLPKPYWIEMYDTNFTFPDGLQISHTPGGAIFQTYVTFPNETVPYKISTGLGENTDHKTVTILSIHKDPQAGYAIYNNTVRLLVNWPKIHPEIMINNFNGAYKTDQPIDFQIEVKGFDYYDAGEQPNVEIEKPDGSLVWKSSGPYIVMCCPAELVNYDKTFNFTNLGGLVTIDKPGSYNLMISYNGQKIQKQFTVVQSVTSIFDTGVYPFSTDVTNTNFTINYNITGNGKIFDAKMNTNSQTLAVLINATEDGQLVIVLPRNMIHSTTYTNMDDMFIVLSNQQEIQYKEFHNTLDARTLLIPFQKGVDKIEIIGTSPI